MKKKLTKSQAGKLGAKATHQKRYDILMELRKYTETTLYVHLPKWPTEHLRTLLKAYQND